MTDSLLRDTGNLECSSLATENPHSLAGPSVHEAGNHLLSSFTSITSRMVFVRDPSTCLYRHHPCSSGSSQQDMLYAHIVPQRQFARIKQHGPKIKKKTAVFIWNCVNSDMAIGRSIRTFTDIRQHKYGGSKLAAELSFCPDCSHARCASCSIRKILKRARSVAPSAL